MIKRYIVGFLLIAGAFLLSPAEATLTVLAQFAPTTRAQYPNPANFLNITGISGNGTTVTVTLSGSTTVTVGTAVIIYNCPVSAYNGGHVVTASSAGSFSYSNATTTTYTAPTTAAIVDTSSNTSTTITAATNDGATVTATLASTSGFTTGDLVTVNGLVPVTLNGTYVVSVVNGTTVTYANTTTAGTATFSTIGQQNFITGFGSTNGAFDVVEGGAKLSGDSTNDGYGYSEIPLSSPHLSGYQINTDMGSDAGIGLGFTSTQRQNFCDSQFIDISRINISSSQPLALVRCIDQNNSDMWSCEISASTGNFITFTNNVPTDTGVAVPINQTFELRYVQTCVSTGSPGNYSVYIGYRLCGTTTWITIFTGTSLTYYDYGYYAYTLTNGPGSGASWLTGRFSLPTIMQTTNFATDSTASLSTLATPIIDPQKPVGGYTWYWDPAQQTGAASDTNSGLDSAHPLLTANYITTMGEYDGFCPAPASTAWQTATGGVASGTAYPITNNAVTQMTPAYLAGQLVLTGDKLIINNNNFNEIRLPDQGLNLNVDALTVASSGGTASPATLSRFKVLTTPEWTNVSGSTWSTTDTGSLSVLYENRRTMTLATSLANCEATQGSFYNSGSTLYVNPFNGTNPTTDGNVYERTTVGNGGSAGLIFNCYNFLCQGVHTVGIITNTDNGTYSFQNTLLPSPSLAVFDTDKCTYYDKHGFASVGAGASTNNSVLYLSDIAEGASPYGGVGTTTALADYTNSGSGNQCAYWGCSLGQGLSQVLGSTQFFNAHGNAAVWTSHQNSGTYGITATFTNCNLPGVFGPTYQYLNFNNCVLSNPNGTNNNGVGNTVFNRCTLTGSIPAGTLNNCLVIPNANVNQTITTILNNCTVDYTGLATNPMTAASGINLTLNECLMLCSTSPFVTALPTTGIGSFASNYCEWQAPASQALVATVNSPSGLTLAAMQTQSLDTGSVSLNGTAASVTPGTYQRTAQSSLTKLIGPFTDYTGVNFAQRQTIGAYEWVASGGVGTTTIITGGSGNPNTPVHY